MAGVFFKLRPGKVATGTALKTMLQLLAASQQRVRVWSWSVAFDGISNTDVPILVQLMRQADAGSGGTAVTPQKNFNGDPETIQTTGLAKISGTWTSEPTAGVVVDEILVHPQGGYVWVPPNGIPVDCQGGTRLAIVATAGVGVNCSPVFHCEE